MDDIMVIDTSYQFPFEQAWEESVAYWDCDKKGKKHLIIGGYTKIVFKLKKKNDFDLFFGGSLDKRCIMWGEGYKLGMATSKGMIYFNLYNTYADSTKLSYTIYKKKTYNLKADLDTLFKFNVWRDNMNY